MNKSKKYIIIVCIIILIAVAALMSNFIYRSFHSNNEDITMVGDTIESNGKVMEFEYQKHKFINIMKETADGKSESFVVHDPNCKCTSRKLNNITTVITNTDNKNTRSSDSIVKANFRIILNKMNELHKDNIALMKQVSTLRTEVAMLKKSNYPVKKVVKRKK